MRLERNYRSTAPILAAAAAADRATTKGRLGKTLRLRSATMRQGEKVSVVSLWDSDEEARMVGERVEALRRQGSTRSPEMAILVRAGFQTRVFRRTHDHPGVSRTVWSAACGSMSAPKSATPSPICACCAQPGDDLAFERIVNVPRRGVWAMCALRA